MALVALPKYLALFWDFASFSLEESKEQHSLDMLAQLLGITVYIVNLILNVFLSMSEVDVCPEVSPSTTNLSSAEKYLKHVSIEGENLSL